MYTANVLVQHPFLLSIK